MRGWSRVRPDIAVRFVVRGARERARYLSLVLLLNGQEHRSVSVAQDATMPAAAAAEDELETLDRCIDCGVYNPGACTCDQAHQLTDQVAVPAGLVPLECPLMFFFPFIPRTIPSNINITPLWSTRCTPSIWLNAKASVCLCVSCALVWVCWCLVWERACLRRLGLVSEAPYHRAQTTCVFMRVIICVDVCVRVRVRVHVRVRMRLCVCVRLCVRVWQQRMDAEAHLSRMHDDADDVRTQPL